MINDSFTANVFFLYLLMVVLNTFLVFHMVMYDKGI